MKILDIDLDFFLDKKYCGIATNVKRLSGKNFKPWTSKAVEDFLEKNCGLNKTKKVSGRVFIHHDELFYYLRKLQEQADFNLTFSIDHIDAHGDLGTGDASYIYIATSVLNKAVKERAYIDKINGLEGISAGNFLAFAIACRWVDSLNYINNINWTDDTQWFNFREFDTKTNSIQLKQFTSQQIESIIYGKGEMVDRAKATIPVTYEPEVPFRVIDHNLFTNTDKYDYIFLTQSPGFTPKSSDKLIPTIKQYINLDENEEINCS